MRDIIFKSSTSAATKKQDICIEEVIDKDGVLATTQRHCRYFILGRVHVDDMANIEKIADLKFANIPYKKRHYYVLKIHDSRYGEDKLFCKIAGMFYAMYGNELYCIAYIHSFRITFTALTSDKGDADNGF